MPGDAAGPGKGATGGQAENPQNTRFPGRAAAGERGLLSVLGDRCGEWPLFRTVRFYGRQVRYLPGRWVLVTGLVLTLVVLLGCGPAAPARPLRLRPGRMPLRPLGGCSCRWDPDVGIGGGLRGGSWRLWHGTEPVRAEVDDLGDDRSGDSEDFRWPWWPGFLGGCGSVDPDTSDTSRCWGV